MNELAPVAEQHPTSKEKAHGWPKSTVVPSTAKMKITHSSHNVEQHEKTLMTNDDTEADGNAGFTAAIVKVA